MPLSVSYMGTKRRLAPLVADVVSRGPRGPLLDLFSGMCAVGSAVAPSRPIWTNDAQKFAADVATAFFTSKELPLSRFNVAELAYHHYAQNVAELSKHHDRDLKAEDDALASKTIRRIASLSHMIQTVGTCPRIEKERIKAAKNPNAFPYRLFTIIFSGGYLSLRQCVQVDSIRFSADKLFIDRKISSDQHRWMLLALCQAMCKASTTTGHFAQFLKINRNSKRRFLVNRKKSIWWEWLDAIDDLVPIGSKHWRCNNKVFQEDALVLLEKLAHNVEVPAIVYADPPYTRDQYSRYYHLYETLLLYDYPPISGIGQYRTNRFSSTFSIKTKVAFSFEELMRKCAHLGSQLVISYPEKGLLPNAKDNLLSMLKKFYSKVDTTHSVDHYHSSLGASKGKQKYSVTELIFWARS